MRERDELEYGVEVVDTMRVRSGWAPVERLIVLDFDPGSGRLMRIALAPELAAGLAIQIVTILERERIHPTPVAH